VQNVAGHAAQDGARGFEGLRFIVGAADERHRLAGFCGPHVGLGENTVEEAEWWDVGGEAVSKGERVGGEEEKVSIIILPGNMAVCKIGLR